MGLWIACTFTDSLARLTGEEQKAIKTTAFDLQLSPTNPGLKYHKLHDDDKDAIHWMLDNVVKINDVQILKQTSANAVISL